MGRDRRTAVDGSGGDAAIAGVSLTRRALLARFALATGAAASAELVSIANAVAAASAGFTTARRRTFVALVAAYDRQPGSLVSSAGRDLVTEQAKRYAALPESARRFVDSLLDALEVAPQAGRFSDLTVGDRRLALRSWWQGRDPWDDAPRRPGDDQEPPDVRASNQRLLPILQAVSAAIPASEKALDPATRLPRYIPPAPSTPYKPPAGDPMSRERIQLRLLRFDAYRLVASLFSDDRSVVDEVTFA